MIDATSARPGRVVDLVEEEGPQQTRATFVERYVCIMDGGTRGDGRNEKVLTPMRRSPKAAILSCKFRGFIQVEGN